MVLAIDSLMLSTICGSVFLRELDRIDECPTDPSPHDGGDAVSALMARAGERGLSNV